MNPFRISHNMSVDLASFLSNKYEQGFVVIGSVNNCGFNNESLTYKTYQNESLPRVKPSNKLIIH